MPAPVRGTEPVSAQLPRLHPSQLAALPATVARPMYARAGLSPGIVHLGVGAFQRAHLAAVNEAALHADGDFRWGIAGVSLRSAATRDALQPQDGLYTLQQRGPSGGALRVIGCLREVAVAPERPGRVLDLIADPAARILSLTITEKGYTHDPASGALQLDHPDVQHDLGHAEAPRSALGFLVHGLQQRRLRGQGPLTLLSLDNLPANGRLLRALVLRLADEVDPALSRWIGSHCSFPSSMVDRIVPATTDADRKAVSAALGLQDAWPVIAEPFLDWVLEDRFVADRPWWEEGGARFVGDVAPFETLKLRMVNGAHSAIAYLGGAAGRDTVDQVMDDPVLRAFIDALLREEVAPTLPPLPGLDIDIYRRRLLARFHNPALGHRTAQIAMDGSQKLPQRLLGTVQARLAAGAPIPRLALAVAGWLHYLGGVDERGRRHAIDDPMAEILGACLAAADVAADAAASEASGTDRTDRARAAAMAGLVPVFGEALGRDARFISALAEQWGRLRRGGVHAAVEACA